MLGVSDADGGIAAFNHEDEFQWRRPGNGESGWMVRCDDLGIYQGHSHGVTAYDWETGKELWHRGTGGAVLFGWQEADSVYAGTSNNQVRRLTKRGDATTVYQCDAAVFSCAASENGRYVFAGDNYSSVYCFDAHGTRLWKLGTGCGSAYSMHYRDDRLYIVTTDGHLACIDASEAAIRAAESGTVPTAVDIKAPRMEAVVPSATVEVVADSAGRGVIVECVRTAASCGCRWCPRDTGRAGGSSSRSRSGRPARATWSTRSASRCAAGSTGRTATSVGCGETLPLTASRATVAA